MQPCSNPAALLHRSLSLAAGASLAALLVVAAPGDAQAQLSTYCVNCSTVYTQLSQYAKEAQSMATQLQQYQTQLNQYTNMVTNTVSLPSQVWSTAQSDILRVQYLSNAASLLSGNTGSMLTRLQNTSSYVNQVGNLSNIPSQLTGYQQSIGNNLSTMGRTLGIQQGQEASNAALLASLQQHSQTAQGQMQALQAGNELAHQNATQLLQIQATLSTTAQMQATQMAVDADRQATNDAAMTHFNSAPPVATTGYL